LPAPNEPHVDSDDGKDDRIGREQIAEILHRSLKASVAEASNYCHFLRRGVS
jgi:hypothetical protein